ncbi:MAG: DUF433 domain-containing protein [Blastocatellia bacterium]
MLLEDYFDFLSPNEIRLKGHRIGIEDVLYEHIYNDLTPVELAERFPMLSAEQIYATILYRLNNRERVDAYLAEWLDHGRRMLAEHARNPTPTMMKLRRAKAELGAERATAEPKQAELQTA